jgi:hypothetical protein
MLRLLRTLQYVLQILKKVLLSVLGGRNADMFFKEIAEMCSFGKT